MDCTGFCTARIRRSLSPTGRSERCARKGNNILSKMTGSVGSRSRTPQDEDGDGNEKQTKYDQEETKNRARDAYVSKLTLKQTDASDSDERQPAKPERDSKAMKSAFVQG
jgi:hypothetical protein